MQTFYQRLTRLGTLNFTVYWTLDNCNIKLWYEEAGCNLSTVCMDSLNGMCVLCLWGSETFVVDFLNAIYIPEK